MNMINSVITVVVGIAILALYLVAKWRIFVKMGEKGWKALIPIYSDYIMFKNVWSIKAFATFVGIEVASSIASCIVPRIGGTPQMILMFGSLALTIASIVMLVKYAMRISRAFGHGVGYGIGLFLAGPIFDMILGFGDSEYARA